MEGMKDNMNNPYTSVSAEETLMVIPFVKLVEDQAVMVAPVQLVTNLESVNTFAA